jgi:protein-disulfide isomerase
VQGPLHQLLADHQGKVRLVYIHTANSPRSTRAAEASECAYRQRKFWAYKDKVFEQQAVWGQAPDWQERLISYASEVGADMGAFLACLRSGEVRPAIQADLRAGETYRIEYTPTIIMDDGSRFVGSDIEPLKKAVEGALRLRGSP